MRVIPLSRNRNPGGNQGTVCVEVCHRSLQTLTFFKEKIVHLATLFRTIDLIGITLIRFL